ncbi:hypothetical protein BX661DRAFT_178755 [Kickxella alabastrina]|uniref:uncharacterized protein n=1 Tax=Kickxella alabastrina TaxID=61397 RepID=UPI00221FF2D1|nr:uncharacterized protein BX661DRAFT_178755 [Kickxella alabastrina]KAI7832902.1 hypothetical protein BX661DRAFT_178755 [Kickxella alabastrina]KAJ1945795.1 hypothetical protein GGF37_001517 [Kickxella alabastrina]
MASPDFDSIPILDLNQATTNKQQFLSDLRHALIHVGFFYIKNHSIPATFLQALTTQTTGFFDLPLEEKHKSDKIHSPTFLGYSTQGNEITKNKKDNREQFDFANELPAPVPNEPVQRIHEHLTGPNLWPSNDVLPGFRQTILEFHRQALDLSSELISLVAEALGLHPGALLDQYVVPGQQHRGKLIKYPAIDQLHQDDGDQGVGAHRDTASLLTILYQASNLPGLQVQNHAGHWIDAPTVPNTFVVNIGTGLEYLVRGVAVATTHRVLNPPAHRGPRYSVAFFQGARLDRKLMPVDGLAPEVLEPRKVDVVTDSGHQFSQVYREDPGLYAVLNRISSHRDVGVKYYPELAQKHGITVGST